MSMFTCCKCGYEGKWPGTRCPRCCQARRLDTFALVAAAIVAAVLLWLPAGADTCPGCMDPAPEPPPPISEQNGTRALFLPFLVVSEVTGEGGSGILPVRKGD